MIRTTNVVTLVSGANPVRYYEFAGLHDDTKPTDKDIATGSTLVEVDTGDVYMYDEVGKEWHKVCALGGAD